MPLLRRRSRIASETDMRRHSLHATSPTATYLHEPLPPLPQHLGVFHDGADDDRDRQHRRLDSSDNSELTSSNNPAPLDDSNKHRRFSILRFRNASDSQLSLRARQQAEKPPPIPRPPEIITTAPTGDFAGPKKKTSRISLGARLRRSHDIPRTDASSTQLPLSLRHTTVSFAEEEDPSMMEASETSQTAPLPTQSSMASEASDPTSQDNRESESSRSDAASIDRMSHTSPNTTPKRSQGLAPFFRFRRTKKAPEPMFPVGHLQPNKGSQFNASSTSLNMATTPRPSSAQSVQTTRQSADKTDNGRRANVSPATALFAPSESRSGHSSPTRANFLRGRSSTMSSIGRDSNDDHLLPPTTRTSSSTGRKSFGDLLGLSRLRQNSDLSRQGTATPATPGSMNSKSNSLQLTRDVVTLPERREEESPAKYLARLEEMVSRKIIAASLSKGTDPFSAAVLRSYMRSFSFFGDPMDMSIRKLLMEAELPKETQQIDRCLQAFANRYHECNPGIYSSPDQAYFIAFSLLILHTDVFNKNNKYKMQKADYLKNTRGEGIFDDILECFYDNICYTPFIHMEEDVEPNGGKTGSMRRRTPLLSSSISDPAKRTSKEPIDPYTLILEGNLDTLRPSLGDAMQLEDHFDYLGTAKSLNLKDLQKTFFRTGVLQIVSARSRPDAFMTEKTATNPADAHPGIVDIKVTKVGLLWRKDAKKRRTRSPWQEWGAILTGAQLYFFRNTAWVKNLMHQYESHIKAGQDGIPIIFNPPLEEFKPDALMTTQGAVALLDTTYKKHKNAFVYVRPNGLDEVLLADDEDELNDWLAKLNYAAAFRTSGVKMRGITAGNLEGQARRGMRRLDSSDATHLVQTPTGPVSIARGQIDHKMVEEIQSARRDIMRQKIEEAEEKMEEAQKKLDEQLRNARHLQILAPIQPRTREQVLAAAARMAAQLKWTRMEIWREKCHRDILVQEMAEDGLLNESTNTSAKETAEFDRPVSQTSKASVIRNESKATQHREPMKDNGASPELQTDPAAASPDVNPDEGSPLDQVFQTPPQSATHTRNPSLPHARPDHGAGRQGSISSINSSAIQSMRSTSHAKRLPSRDEKSAAPKSADSPDDVDAEEHDFLKQAGLLEDKSDVEQSDKAVVSTSPDATDSGHQDKNKIRRSLQRTLREGAGHLHNHRSRRGRDSTTGHTSDDAAAQEDRLARGTGSFVVHGKKASVIRIGTDLQNMPHEEQLWARRQSEVGEVPPSSSISVGDDDDFHSAVGVLVDSNETAERRDSAASAGTATARSFRELHRKYSTAQAARSTSTGGRLQIPSDAESESAVSFSEGRRSPLPPIETSNDSDDAGSDAESDAGRADADNASVEEHAQIPNRSIQAVGA
ncbi:hypothetical protein B0I35DRAFT_482210 [Stachybotrys elegans]|uniref:SEC7 domain-containing protein n=1 Tax=Stachybotrys elegans TaxID=80388 RepID=A0A8K0SIY1_9HYPO|nr:hypothetical protein B0I35DRAFT_482210 [Stachybotrys elegans]